jgi:superfamily I DNA/RNA helicase
MYEAQGVEFDTVCLVGIDEQKFSLIGTSHELALEIKKIQQDLLYVALTRAISELHVLGKTTLQNYLNK